ncbi:ANL family adenylate-forming protein [Campylobacter insulaenigrae]|uniref:ANL family adenylate-forming protein n=1 Tax=Campylobacter insulaenigrae TaxID=260714 RepID=UPI0021527607|nr:fatty acid--CoA ligase family protein [Campylobacter insulaenigrae]MCR6574034.1 fatty acid--CoA ligase family protein [Campylobacter insulaenigrae]MCR6580342.1 fatty acid--CoA ligase family protein [Campylobacter insulaenigrae]MCR6586454.1 fatty acid--CoA ligase family protein [Campylobacter insulaenigrae]
MDKLSFSHPFLNKLIAYKDLNCLVYKNRIYSYLELFAEVKKYINKLDSINGVVGILGDYDLQSIALLLACIEKRLIIAPFLKLSNQDFEQLENKIYEGQIDYLYDGEKFISYKNNNSKHHLLKTFENHSSSGLILFSSGSTGKPKAIVHNLDLILNVYQDKKSKIMNIILFLMFDHIGGLNTLFNVLAMGACGIALEDRKNIELLAENIQKYQVSLLPANPSLLNLMLISGIKERYNLNSLKLITYGTEKMDDSLLNRLKLEFPKVRFHQTFGTSEVGIAQTKTKNNMIKLESMEYKIINNELYLKSKTQSLGYLNADNSVFDKDGYFATGDLVEFCQENGEEYIKIIGRSKELINIGGEKVIPQEVENIILELDYVQDCLVYAKLNIIMGQSICAKIVLKPNQLFTNLELKKQLRKYCKSKLADYKIPTQVEIVDQLELSERFKKIRK